MRAVVLLCDWAETLGGKLYAQGIGWSRVAADTPIPFAVAFLLHVEYTETNVKHEVSLHLKTEDGQDFPADDPAKVDVAFEVGRPPGTKPGQEQIVPFAVKFGGVVFPTGTYRFEVALGEQILDTATFMAASAQGNLQ